MTPAISSGLQGWNTAQSALSTTAAQIAQWPAAQLGSAKPAASTNATPVDTLDLSDTMVSLIQAKNNGAANLQTIHVADEMQKDLLDILA